MQDPPPRSLKRTEDDPRGVTSCMMLPAVAFDAARNSFRSSSVISWRCCIAWGAAAMHLGALPCHGCR